MEDRLAAQAVPRLSHAAAAQALDSDTERLVRTLGGQANDAHAGQRTGSGQHELGAAAYAIRLLGRAKSALDERPLTCLTGARPGFPGPPQVIGHDLVVPLNRTLGSVRVTRPDAVQDGRMQSGQRAGL